jgi:hypothetical protein
MYFVKHLVNWNMTAITIILIGYIVIIGTRRFLRYKAEICILSDFLYYLLTTIAGK